MTTSAELRWLDAHAQAELIRSGELAPGEAVAAAIARIEQLDPAIGAVSSTRFEQAVAEAAGPAPDGQVAPGAPVAGVPFLVKDLGPPCAGTETTAGSAFLAGFVADHDGELIRRYRRAGLIVVGKSRTAELGVLPTTEPVHGGPTRNPWDPGRSAGGSSGGAAAAVALGLVPLAHANDAGGSIRIPAACCGVFGLKPTRARTPLGPDVGDLMSGLAVEHVVSRSVRDSAAALDLTAGPAPGDPYWAPPAPSFRRAVAEGPGRRLRIGVVPSPPGSAATAGSAGGPLHPDCAAAVAGAARLCAELGHDVDEAVPPVAFADLADLFLVLWAAGVSSAISGYAAASGRTPRPEAFEPLTWSLYERGRALSAADYLLAVTRLQQAARRIAAFHDRWDMVLSPVTAEPAPPLGTFATGSPDDQMNRAVAFVLDTPLANVTGQPAMAVPLHVGATGLPAGVQVSGRFGDEAGLLALAGQLERAAPWARPPAAPAAVPA